MLSSGSKFSDSQIRQLKPRRWQRLLRRLVVFGYVIFSVSALLALWLNLNVLINYFLNIRNTFGSVCFIGGGFFAFRLFNLRLLRRLIGGKRGTWLSYENVYMACQMLWILGGMVGAILDPNIRQSQFAMTFILIVLATNHAIFVLYRRHMKALEIRLASLGAREEKIHLGERVNQPIRLDRNDQIL